jgi:hypothetical protein
LLIDGKLFYNVTVVDLHPERDNYHEEDSQT